MRKSKIIALTVGQIKDRVVHVDRAWKDNKGTVVGLPKNGKARDIVLCDEIYARIEENLKNKNPKDFLFQNSNKNSLYCDYNGYWVKFKKEIIEAFNIDIKNSLLMD
jgi:hypothetical protein